MDGTEFAKILGCKRHFIHQFLPLFFFTFSFSSTTPWTVLKQLNTVFSCLVGQAAFVSTKRPLVLQPMPVGAAVRNVTSNSSQCICTKTVYHNDHTIYTFVSYSAANISVIAKNDVSVSPPAILQVPAEPASDLEGRCVKCIDINIVYIYVQVDHKAEFLSGSLQQNFGL